MDGAYWIVFVVAAVICAWLEGTKDAEKPKLSWMMPVMAVVGLGVLMLVVKQYLGLNLDAFPLGLILASVLALAITAWRRDSVFGLLAAGALAPQVINPPPAVADASLFNPVFLVWLVAGWIGACIAWGGNARGGVAFAGVAALVGMANRWTPVWFGKIPNFAGSMLAMAIIAAALIVLLLGRKKEGGTSLLAGGLGILLVAGAGFLVAQWGGDDLTLPVTIFASVVAAFAITWMSGVHQSASQRTSQVVLGGLMWMGVATLAYAQDQSFGLGMAALAGLGAYALMGRIDLSVTMGPLIALGLYRTFRAEVPELVRAFDIAQHYGMVGVMIGAGLIVLLLGMPRLKEGETPRNWARFGVLALMAAVAGMVGLMFFGIKGGVGFLVGLGLGTWMAGVISKQGSYGLAPLVGLSGLVGLSYAKASESFELTRDEKMTLFMGASAALVVLMAILIFALTDKAMKTEVQDETVEMA